jgi:transcriptional regulator GlxA family with amidase domain
LLRAFGAHPVGDDRIVQADDRLVTCAGVSAGIDLGLWLAARLGGESRAEAIQLSMEYDPQPPFDSGHMSKASAATKATAVALMGRELASPAALTASAGLLWDAALRRVRRRGPRPVA